MTKQTGPANIHKAPLVADSQQLNINNFTFQKGLVQKNNWTLFDS
jgi:hypothetical protein